MSDNIVKSSDYKAFITEIKQHIRTTQLKAVVTVNTSLLLLYWDLAKRMVEKQQQSAWERALLSR